MKIPAHCCILWARLPGLRSHIEEAYKLQGQKPYVIEIENDAEMNEIFSFLDDAQFNLGTPRQTAAAAPAATGPGNAANNNSKSLEHEW